MRETWGLGQPVDAELLDELVHAAGADPCEVAVGDDGDKRRLRALAPLEEPFGEVRAGAELGDGHVDRASTGVQGAVTVAVAGIGAVLSSGAVISAADSVCLSGQDVVDDVTEHLAH